MTIEAFYEEIYMPFTPRPHQALEFRHYRDEKARACLWKMRTGKSKAMIDLSFYHFDKKSIKSVFIIAPNGVHYNWVARELPSHAWLGQPYNAYSWASKNKSGVVEVEKLIADPRPFFFAVNTDAIMLDRVLGLIKKLLKRGPALLIVDESHHFRTPGAKRTKRLRGLAKRFQFVRILTGSSVDNSPFAAYSQFELLGDATLGHKNYASFKEAYGVFENVTYGGRYQPKVIGYQNQDVLQQAIARVSTVVGSEGLSEFVHTTEYFEMSKKQESLYKEVRKGLLIALENGLEIKGPEAGAKLIKLQQIASGFIIDDQKQVHSLVPIGENPRLKTLETVLESIEGKVIIWCKFKEDLRLVGQFLETLKIKSVEYHGSISQEKRQSAVDSFMKDASVRAFLGQPQAGGEGLNLSSASTIIWYSHVFDAIQRNQASARATMAGGKNIALIDICAMDTVDTKILGSLSEKKTIADLLINAKEML